MKKLLAAAAAGLALLAIAGPAGRAGRAGTGLLQGRPRRGWGGSSLPAPPGGRCYETPGRGGWPCHTQIVSPDGACIEALGPGPVRLTSSDGDQIPSTAIFYVNHSNPYLPVPWHIAIRGLRLVVPAGL